MQDSVDMPFQERQTLSAEYVEQAHNQFYALSVYCIFSILRKVYIVDIFIFVVFPLFWPSSRSNPVESVPCTMSFVLPRCMYEPRDGTDETQKLLGFI